MAKVRITELKNLRVDTERQPMRHAGTAVIKVSSARLREVIIEVEFDGALNVDEGCTQAYRRLGEWAKEISEALSAAGFA